MKMRRWKIAGAVALLAGSIGSGRAFQLLKTEEATIDVGGRFQTIGEFENIKSEPIRSVNRIYLFQVQNRLKLSGNFEGTKFFFEEALGGEAINSSNNQLNLLEFNAEVPVIEDVFSIIVGQFKVPTNLQSADYDENLLFTGRSLAQNWFFNQGYDLGLVLKFNVSPVDALFGVVAGAPDMPQRYLPEVFNMPPLLIARIGAGNFKEDPFHPKQEGFEKSESLQWAVHAGGIYGRDSNAGHSTLLALQGGYATTFSANGPYANAVMNSNWNPFLGKTAPNFGLVNATYGSGGVDIQLRALVGELTLTVQGQANWSQFSTQDFQAFYMKVGNSPTKTLVTSGDINIAGFEGLASLGNKKFAASGRIDIIMPDPNFAYKSSGAGTSASPYIYNQITGADPIYEITAPSLMLHVNKRVKLIAETTFILNAPESLGDDGVYELLEQPQQVTVLTPANPAMHAGLVTIARMMFQFAF
ncbi:MAG: hypothetical protein V4498_10250 [candidate division FCPU426 bacterium]